MTALNVQLARDEVAHVLGGTLIDVTRPGVYGGVGAVAAGGKTIKFAYGRTIEPGSLGEDGVVAIVFYEGTTIGGGGGDLVSYTHRLRVELVLSIRRGTLQNADAILTPFIGPIRDALALKTKLNSSVDSSDLDSISDIKDSTYPDRLAIDFNLAVTQKEAVARAA